MILSWHLTALATTPAALVSTVGMATVAGRKRLGFPTHTHTLPQAPCTAHTYPAGCGAECGSWAQDGGQHLYPQVTPTEDQSRLQSHTLLKERNLSGKAAPLLLP